MHISEKLVWLSQFCTWKKFKSECVRVSWYCQQIALIIILIWIRFPIYKYGTSKNE